MAVSVLILDRQASVHEDFGQYNDHGAVTQQRFLAMKDKGMSLERRHRQDVYGRLHGRHGFGLKLSKIQVHVQGNLVHVIRDILVLPNASCQDRWCWYGTCVSYTVTINVGIKRSTSQPNSIICTVTDYTTF